MSEALAYSSPEDVRNFEWHTFIGERAISGSVEYVVEEGPPNEPKKETEGGTWFDIANYRLLIGRTAYEEYMGSAYDEYMFTEGNFPDVRPLGELLRAEDLSYIPSRGRRSRGSDLPKEELKIYGQWLINLLKESGKSNGQKDINERVIKNAFRLGLGPSYQEIARRTYSSLTEFYNDLDADNVHRMHGATEPEEFLEHYTRLEQTLGRKPTVGDLRDFYHADPRNNPSADRFLKGLEGIKNAHKMAGHEIYADLSLPELVAWGIRFMLANNGAVPTRDKINYLSKKDFGPYSETLSKRFNGLLNFQAEVKKAYGIELARRQKRRFEILSEIKDSLNLKIIPGDLFYGVESGDELLIRFAKYRVLSRIFNGSKIFIKKQLSIDPLPDNEFVQRIQDIEPEISMDMLRKFSDEFGYLDVIWPQAEYMSQLKIETEN